MLPERRASNTGRQTSWCTIRCEYATTELNATANAGFPIRGMPKLLMPTCDALIACIHPTSRAQTESVVLYLTAISMAATPDCAAPSE